ncbi:MAG: hypothetical protein LBJ63_04840, partial [Prevotellaceae bacterium]|nr:hypothetical protein [Prevotellaceae bacterium]
ATTGLQIAAINREKYAKGGLIGGDKMAVVKGRSHAQGGHQIYIDGKHIGEIEGDELLAIVNKRDTRRLSALSKLNSIHGKKFADGGMISPVPAPANFVSSSDSQMENILRLHNDTLLMIEAINSRIDNIQVVVVESDITATQQSVKKVQVKSSF